ncbi:MAG: hypothetical protein JSS01_13455 [Proteobacteria bacterium]|nr:hypothetical protein [Pseudomonadota bacterium]
MFKRFFDPATIYARRARSCLDEARMAALEHENAAEHHMALAKMYRHRAARLEAELAGDGQARLVSQPAAPLQHIATLKKHKEANQAQAPYLAQGAAS